MRRTPALAALVGVLAFAAPPLQAKFGISKTKIWLPRLKPPERALRADTVALDVRATSGEVSSSHVSIVRERLVEALRHTDLFQLTERERDADAVIEVELQSLYADIRDEIRIEQKYTKIGKKQVWNDKKKTYETKDVWDNVDTPVSWRVADGGLDARVSSGDERSDANVTFRHEWKASDRAPDGAQSEEALRRHLAGLAAERALGVFLYAPDPVEVLLAVNGELKAGNEFAQAGKFEEALNEWTKKAYKGGTEAARLHNVGVAYEALAYALPPHSPGHQAQLEKAQDAYLKAQRLDPGEKHFREPPPRIEQSLAYAADARRMAEELARFKEGKQAAQARKREARSTPPPEPPPPAQGSAAPPAAPPKAKPRQTPKPAAAPSPSTPTLSGSASAGPPQPAAPLRNGSFEPALPPWLLTGQGGVVEEARRGRVLEATAGAGVSQGVDVALAPDRPATLSVDYKVVAGEGRIQAVVGYLDAAGKARTAPLPITAGEEPAGWSSWSSDVAALRPRPARIKEIRLAVESGTVRLDNVALTVR